MLNLARICSLTFLFTFLCSSFAVSGNLTPAEEFGNTDTYAITQDGEVVGYAGVYFKDGHVNVSVVNITGERKKVRVSCELNNASSTSSVNPGSLRLVDGIGLVASGAVNFSLTRDFCGWPKIWIEFE